MKKINRVWILWFILVCVWNFGWPNVSPIYDVVIATILSILFKKISCNINKNIKK